MLVAHFTLLQITFWRRSKTVNRGGHSTRLQLKASVNQRTTEAVGMPTSANELKK
jgi:hypothetical protein